MQARAISNEQALAAGLAPAISCLSLFSVSLGIYLRKIHRRKRTTFANREAPSSATLCNEIEQSRIHSMYGNLRTELEYETGRSMTPVSTDDTLIHICTKHWERPFLRSESLRDLIPARPLRVMNPDLRPAESDRSQLEILAHDTR